MPPRLRCLTARSGQVKREPGQGSMKIPGCLGCPRNGKQARTYQGNFPRFPDATVNSPVHGKAMRQILRARIPASDAYGHIAWGDILTDISFVRSSRDIFLFPCSYGGMHIPGQLWVCFAGMSCHGSSFPFLQEHLPCPAIRRSDCSRTWS